MYRFYSFFTRLLGVGTFHETIHSLLEILKEKADIIQHAQLQALGNKSRVEGEVERRKSKEAQMKSLIMERQAELNRYFSF